MTNTRTQDLDLLDVSRDKVESDEGRLHREALLESVYHQSKDSFLESKRRELATWITRGLSYAPDDTGIPTKKQKEGMALAEVNIQRLEREIKDYANSDEFKAKIASKVSKISLTEADILLKKGQ